MQVISLASGSSGNCYLVQAGKTNVLIDCGLTVTNLKKYLAKYNVQPEQLSAIFLTHEHSDHVRGAASVSRQWGVPIIANQLTLDAARYRWQKYENLEIQRSVQTDTPLPKPDKRYSMEMLPIGGVRSFGPLEISSFPVSHDAAQTVCYTFKADNQQAVILTDLGCATPEIFEPLNASQLIILEANHDLQTLRQSKYPASLKARIESKVGHLSNQQSVEILQKVLEQSGLERTVWLAHLSEQNNKPETALATIENHLKKTGLLKKPKKAGEIPALKIEVAERDKPSSKWDSQATYFQTEMFFS